ncbi:MAG: nucleotide sugar dehydrogenase [Gemmatimonadetes bacterium]|nr:nucleotide sugar dehydrogenase [Gemmatimonadota bacterium]
MSRSRNAAEILIAKAEDRSATFAVMGLGYAGLPLAVELAASGFRVVGVDIDQAVVDGINGGRSHVSDVSSERLKSLVSDKFIEATVHADRVSDVDVVCICVPTPLSKTKDPDVSYIVAAADAAIEQLRSGQAIILESTTYPGTTRELLLPRIQERGFVVGQDVFLAFSPERVDPGNAKWHTRNTPKVIGGITRECARVTKALYEPVFDTLVPVSSPESAELVKLLENTFRSVNIGLVNEMAIVCDKLHVDVWEVIEAAATKPFGFVKFTPGPGLGGHCIPVDPHYLAWKMRGLNYKTRFIDVAGEVNSEMPAFWVRKVAEALNKVSKPIKGSDILMIGVTYKKDVGDIRESPALDIIRLLVQQGANVSYYDPFVSVISNGGAELECVKLSSATVKGADCIVIATDHSSVDYDLIRREASIVIDTRNALAQGEEGGS